MAGTDIRPFVRKLYIADKNSQIVRLGRVMTPPQHRLLESVQADLTAGKPVRKRILKARQMGFSTMVEAIQFTMAFLIPRYKALVVSHEKESSEHLLSMCSTYWEHFFAAPFFTTNSTARNRLSWAETKSLMTITTANSVGPARSRTLNSVHGSEVAFWTDPETLLTGLNQALPRTNPLTFFFQESTANGVGNWWHRACNAAMRGEDDYDFLFYGWWEHPEYMASQIGRGNMLTGPLILQDDEERALVKFLRARGFDERDVHDKMMWRRVYIATECLGDIEKFHQEYPTTPEEAFVASGRNIFPIEYLRSVYRPRVPVTGDLHPEPNGGVRFVPDPPGTIKGGPLAVYAYPGERMIADYVIGGDGGWTAGGDYACAQVLNRETWEQVATFREKLDANTFGEKMVLLGRYYNNALLVPEANRAGGATIGAIRARGYNNLFVHTKAAAVRGMPDNMYGWTTNETTKQEVISNMQKALYDAHQPHNRDRGLGLLIRDKATYTEMKEYVKLEGRGGIGNSDGTDHDDTVMALGIALTAIIHEAGTMLARGGAGTGGGMGGDVPRLPVSPQVAAFEEKLGDVGVEEGSVVTEDFKHRVAGNSPWLDDGGTDMYSGSWED